MPSRRNFIQSSALALSGSALLPFSVLAGNPVNGQSMKKEYLKIGMAGYTFAKYSIEQTIEIMNRVAVNNLSIKDFHLPLDSSQEKINETIAKFKQGGINIYAVGVIYMKTQAEVDNAFDYAKKVGVDLIVGVPSYDLIEYTEKKVKATNIKIAIHNHGPEDKQYPGPKDVYDRIYKLDSRVGLCLDIGHAFRAGANLEKVVTDYAPRIFDLHVKDVTAAAANAKAIEMGRGAIDFPGFVKALRSIGYKGSCSIEFEKDMSDAVPGIAESVGYLKGVMS
ncbi:MAG: sugar phosphate isomerase/epimerase [Agriterribacter sp.]